MKDMPKAEYSHIHKIFGDEMPHLPRTHNGRTRLVQALAQKFGNAYRTHPAAREALKEFDSEVNYAKTYIKIRRMKNG